MKALSERKLQMYNHTLSIFVSMTILIGRNKTNCQIIMKNFYENANKKSISFTIYLWEKMNNILLIL
jgi:hypothetical protein